MLKELLLQKGWAGKTISRAETVERINPIIRQLITLNHHYDSFIRALPAGTLRESIEASQKTSRMDVGKLAETVFSCGGTAYSGTDQEPDSFSVPRDRISAAKTLLQLEGSFQELLGEEAEVEHQMRTRAILSVVKGNSDARLELLKEAGK